MSLPPASSDVLRAARPSQRSVALSVAILVAVIVAAYWNACSGPFVFDDMPAIVENASIREWRASLSPPSDRGLPVTGRPIVNLSLALNYRVGGLDPRGYHVLNIGLHVGAALLVFGVVRRTFARLGGGRSWAIVGGFGTAAWWALHPLQTAAVSYTIQRAEVLVSIFYLLTIYGLIRGVETSNGAAAAPAREGRARFWLSGSVVACALGMATKEVMVSAPAIAFLYDCTFVTGQPRESWRRRRRYYVALAATWLVLGALMMQTGTRAGTAGFGLGVSSAAYALKQCDAVMHYLRLAVWPSPLVFDYGGMVLVERVSAVWVEVTAIVVLLGVTAWALWRRPKLGFAGAWFFALLAPTSSVVPLADTMFEHRPYLALAGVLALAVGSLRRLPQPMALLVMGLVAGILGTLTAKRNAVYRTEIGLWADTVVKRPANVRAHYTLGAALAAANRVEEALEHYGIALRLDPNSREAHNNLGNLLARLGRWREAVPHYEAALSKQPSAESFNNYGNALLRLGELGAAREQYEAALRLRPQFADAHNNLGNLLAQSGELARAAEHYTAALVANPNLADAHANLGNVLAQTDRVDEAIAHYQAALRLRPDFPDAHFNLAITLAQRRQWAEAIAHYNKVLELRPDYPGARQNLERVRIYQDVLGK